MLQRVCSKSSFFSTDPTATSHRLIRSPLLQRWPRQRLGWRRRLHRRVYQWQEQLGDDFVLPSSRKYKVIVPHSHETRVMIFGYYVDVKLFVCHVADFFFQGLRGRCGSEDGIHPPPQATSSTHPRGPADHRHLHFTGDRSIIDCMMSNRTLSVRYYAFKIYVRTFFFQMHPTRPSPTLRDSSISFNNLLQLTISVLYVQ